MDKTETQEVIRYLQKKGTTRKEIHKDIIHELAEDYSYSENLNCWWTGWCWSTNDLADS